MRSPTDKILGECCRLKVNGIKLVEDGLRIVTDATDFYGFSSYRSVPIRLILGPLSPKLNFIGSKSELPYYWIEDCSKKMSSRL